MKIATVLWIVFTVHMVVAAAPAVEPSKTQASLERASVELEEAVDLLGFEHVRVFTWRGGLLEGTVNLFEEGQDKPLNLTKLVADEARKVAERQFQTSVDPEKVSGVLLIAVRDSRPLKDPNCDCFVTLNVSYEFNNARASYGGRYSGDIPRIREFQLSRSVHGGTSQFSETISPSEGKQFTLYDLKLSKPSDKR